MRFTGDYFAEALNYECRYISDTLTHQSFFGFSGNNSGFNADTLLRTLDSLYAIGFSFDDSVNSGSVYNLLDVYVYGINDGSGKQAAGDIEMSIYDQNQVLLWSDIRVVGSTTDNLVIFSPNLRFNAGTNLYATISADTGVYFYLYQNITTPFAVSSSSGSLSINSIYADTVNTSVFPSTPSNTMPALAFLFESTVGLNENQISRIDLYPNPVEDKLFLNQVFGTDQNLKIYNSAGDLVQDIKLKKGSDFIDVSILNKGFYLLQIENYKANFIKE